ncbi:hypothetical protein MCETALH18_01596 [Methylophilaceae bacterium]
MNKKLAFGFLLITFPSFAFSYIDPGSASYFIQALIALLSAGVFYLRHPIELIKKLIKNFLGK